MNFLLNFSLQTVSRYGLKTRAEIAAMKAEEEDKGKKKGKRSARASARGRTPKSGKKSTTPVGKKGNCLMLMLS